MIYKFSKFMSIFTNTNYPWLQNQSTKQHVRMDEEDNSYEATDTHRQYTFVSQRTVSCIEKNQNKMITFQRTFLDQQQNELALVDNNINHIKENLSVFD